MLTCEKVLRGQFHFCGYAYNRFVISSNKKIHDPGVQFLTGLRCVPDVRDTFPLFSMAMQQKFKTDLSSGDVRKPLCSL